MMMMKGLLPEAVTASVSAGDGDGRRSLHWRLVGLCCDNDEHKIASFAMHAYPHGGS